MLHEPEVTLNSLKELFMVDFREGSTECTKRLLEQVMEWERDMYRKEHLEEIDYRNGYYLRDLKTKLGEIYDLRVPRTRSGLFHPSVISRYERVPAVIHDGIVQMYLRGVSTQNVGPVLKALLGYDISAGHVSYLNRKLDDIIREYHRRKIDDDIVYLFLDGIYLTERSMGKARRQPILVAYGIYRSGKREFLHFRLAKNEGEQEWWKFLNELYRKGLLGSSLMLVVTDGCAGLHAALDSVYPYTTRQRCWAHKMRNLCNKIKQADRERCHAGAQKIYLAQSKKHAISVFRQWKHRWSYKYPLVVKWLEHDLPHLLAFYDMPKEHYKLLRTTNVIERAFEEVRRRTKVMGCLPNPRSINRIVYARMAMLNFKWTHTSRFIKYMHSTIQKAA